MKKIIISAGLAAFLSSAAYAGSMADPVIEQDVIIQDAASSSMSGVALVALLGLIMAIPVLD